MRARGVVARSFLAGLLALSSSVVAQTFTVAVPPLASLLEPDGSGVYQRLLDRALESLDMEIEPLYYPYRRALEAFEDEHVDCLFSLTDVLIRRHGEQAIATSYPLGKFSFHIFTPAGGLPLHSLEELEGRVVGAVMGHEVYLDSVLGDNLAVESARSDSHAVRMLRAGRLDAFIAAIPDMRPFLDELSYSPDHPVLESYDRLNCRNTERNRRFLDALSGELVRLKRAGAYRELAGDFYVPFCVEDDDC